MFVLSCISFERVKVDINHRQDQARQQGGTFCQPAPALGSYSRSSAPPSARFGVEVERVFGAAVLRLVVDMDQAKAFAVAEGPFEIVEQRPDEIALDRDPGGDRVLHRAEIAAQIADAPLVADMPVGLDPVGKGGAVFEDVDRQIAAVALLRLDQTARKASGAISQPISVTGVPGGGGRAPASNGWSGSRRTRERV